MARTSVWTRATGFERLVARETNLSDVMQYCTEKHPEVWATSLGFSPTRVTREERVVTAPGSRKGIADLVLTNGTRRAVVEVKLGHSFGEDQRKWYEQLSAEDVLVLVGLEADERRVAEDIERWKFVGLAALFAAWSTSTDEAVRAIASEVRDVITSWNQQVEAVFVSAGAAGAAPLAAIGHKFLARLVSRRIRDDLRRRGRQADAGVTSGGGLALVQTWHPIEGDDTRRLQAEMRWWEDKQGGELRFGIDFRTPETRQTRLDCYSMARSLDASLDAANLRSAFEHRSPHLASLMTYKGNGRPNPRGDWDAVVTRGFARRNPGGVDGNRRGIRPDFHGDGTLRYQALTDLDFSRTNALDVSDLLDGTLTYLEQAVSESRR